MRTQLHIYLVTRIVFFGMVAQGACALAADDQGSGKVYELRVYHANPGKLDALHARFRDNTCKLFKKHGMEVVGFWTPMQGEEAKNTLYYILAFPSAVRRRRRGRSFAAIPNGRR